MSDLIFDNLLNQFMSLGFEMLLLLTSFSLWNLTNKMELLSLFVWIGIGCSWGRGMLVASHHTRT